MTEFFNFRIERAARLLVRGQMTQGEVMDVVDEETRARRLPSDLEALVRISDDFEAPPPMAA